MHPDIAALAVLVGTWSGAGTGEYPTIEPFEYREEVTFGHTGKPFLTYLQRSTATDGRPLHTETGYLRVPAPGRAEWILAQPTGITEVQEGSLTADGQCLLLDLFATAIGVSASAKEVNAVGRVLRVDGDDLSYTLRMAAVGRPLQHHLSATLHRNPR